MRIPLMKATFLNEDAKNKLAQFCMFSDQFSMGENCAEFEKEFAKIHSRKYGVLVNSGASANLALLQALKNLGVLKTNDLIGFSAVTWATNVMPILQLGMIPVPIDVDLYSMNVNSKELVRTLKHTKIKAFFATHVLGFTGNMFKIEDICASKGITLLEDTCESLGTIVTEGEESVSAGGFSTAATFSFFVGHHLSTIEGGMILTDNEELANMLKMVRANGWDRNLSEETKNSLRYRNHVQSEFYGKYTFYDLGFNIRPTEITGVLGRSQLPYLDDACNKRHENYITVRLATEPYDDFIHLRVSHLNRISAFAMPFICSQKGKREKYLHRFLEREIEVRPLISGDITKQPFWRKYCPRTYSLPNASYIHENGFYCANRPDLTQEELGLIKECVK